MLEGILITDTVNFSSKTDKSDPKSVFVLRPLSGLEVIEALGYQKTEEEANGKQKIIKTRESCEFMLKHSVIETHNFFNELKLPDRISRMPFDVIMEIVGEIEKISLLGAEEEKNS